MPPRKSPRTGHRCKPSCTCGCREVPHRVQDTLPFVTAVLWLSCLHSPGIPLGVRRSSNSLELFVADLPQVLQVHLQLRAPAADLAQPPGPTGPTSGSRLWTPGSAGIAGPATRRPHEGLQHLPPVVVVQAPLHLRHLPVVVLRLLLLLPLVLPLLPQAAPYGGCRGSAWPGPSACGSSPPCRPFAWVGLPNGRPAIRRSVATRPPSPLDGPPIAAAPPGLCQPHGLAVWPPGRPCHCRASPRD